MNNLNKKLVPLEIGICVDGFGFLGLLDLRSKRKKYGLTEFLGVTKDPSSPYYLVDFHRNENTEKNRFKLIKTDLIHAGGVYYVTDTDSFNRVSRIDAYVLYLSDEEYCYIDACCSNTRLPEIKAGKKRWKHYYEVVKDNLKYDK